MTKLTFLSQYDLPDSNITRNFDFGEIFAQNGFEVTFLVNNYDNRKKERIIKSNKYISKQKISDNLCILWISTYRYDGFWGRLINSLEYFCVALFLCITRLRKTDIFIGDTVPLTSSFLTVLVSNLVKSYGIIQVRDVWPYALVADKAIKKYSPVYIILRILEFFSYQFCSKVISTLPFVTDHVHKTVLKKDVKISYIPNPIRLRSSCLRRDCKKLNDNLELLYVGGMGNAHDIETIILAVDKINKLGISINLKLFGDGPKRSSAEELTNRLELNNVKFFGSIPKDQLAVKIKSADLCIATVLDSDAYKFGVNLNKIYDYMAASKPIILCLRGEGDPITKSRCGYLVEPQNPDKLAQAICKFKKLKERDKLIMGQRGHEYLCKNHDIEMLSQKFMLELTSLD